MELFSDCIQAIALDPLVALPTRGGEELLVAVFAVERSLLFHEAHVDEGLATRLRVALEVVRAPVLSQGCHEWAPDLFLAASTDRYSGTDGSVHDAPTSLGGGPLSGDALGGHSSWS